MRLLLLIFVLFCIISLLTAATTKKTTKKVTTKKATTKKTTKKITTKKPTTLKVKVSSNNNAPPPGVPPPGVPPPGVPPPRGQPPSLGENFWGEAGGPGTLNSAGGSELFIMLPPLRDNLFGSMPDSDNQPSPVPASPPRKNLFGDIDA